MMSVAKKILSRIVTILVALVQGAILLGGYIGLTTSPEAAGVLMDEKIPKWLEWLLGTPWWVSTLILIALVLWSFWVTWPDFRQSDEIRQLRKDYKKSNDRAWDFKPTLDSVLDKLKSLEENIAAVETQRLIAHEESGKRSSKLREQADQISSHNIGMDLKVDQLLRDNAQFRASVGQQIQQVISDIPIEVKDEVSKLKLQKDLLDDHTSDLGEIRHQLIKIESRLDQLHQDIEAKNQH